MLYLDQKYLLLISSQLQGFIRKSDRLYNCRCFQCGDSQKKQSKKRGYFFPFQNRLVYKCHNCGLTCSLRSVLKKVNPEQAKAYGLEWLREQRSFTTLPTRPLAPSVPDAANLISADKILLDAGAIPCSELPVGHRGRLYLEKRQLPAMKWSRLWYANNFRSFVREIDPVLAKTIPCDEPRLVIPAIDRQNHLIAVSGRAILPESKLRYQTVRIKESATRILFGLNEMDQYQPLYVCEGPLDSLFLPNAIAVGNCQLGAAVPDIKHGNITLIFDNERRNKELVQSMLKAVKESYAVVFWPETIKEKDINDMIRAGYDLDYLLRIIKDHTKVGLAAYTEWSFWKKT